jgi:DNA-binding XRE family transcriptional regulator
MVFKNNVKAYREKLNISQEELSRRLNICTRTIQNIEAGKNTTIEIAFKLKKVLHANNIEELFNQ